MSGFYRAPQGGTVVGPASSVDGELTLFSDTGGSNIKRSSASGLVKLTAGVASEASAGTDYELPFEFTPLNEDLSNLGSASTARANLFMDGKNYI